MVGTAERLDLVVASVVLKQCDENDAREDAASPEKKIVVPVYMLALLMN